MVDKMHRTQPPQVKRMISELGYGHLREVGLVRAYQHGLLEPKIYFETERAEVQRVLREHGGIDNYPYRLELEVTNGPREQKVISAFTELLRKEGDPMSAHAPI